MLQQIVVLCLVGAAFGFSAGDRTDFGQFEVSTTRPGIPNVDYFDCRTTTKQHNKHPWDCTRYIQCDNSNIAFDMPCAACDDPALCPGGGFLEFDGVEIGGNEPSCIWPVDSTCKPGNETVTNGPTTPTITTTTSGGGDRSCDALNCTVWGDCQEYEFCRRIPSENDDGPVYNEGKLETISCGDKWYNPESDGHQVATCSTWLELDKDTRKDYEKRCIDAVCKLEGACNTDYTEVWGKDKPSVPRRCPAGTVLDDVIRRCVSCSVATRRNPDTNAVESCAGQGNC